jgi:phage gpG-like protein
MFGASITGPHNQDPVTAAKRLVVDAQPTVADVQYAFERERSRILKRTASGVDAHGVRFAAYSPGYAKKKAKYRDPGTVDLRGRNAPHMLQAMLTQADETGGTIGFYDERAAMLAKIHNEGGTIKTRLGKGKGKPKKGGKATFQMPKREFFVAPDDDLRAMEQDIGSRITARLKAQNT